MEYFLGRGVVILATLPPLLDTTLSLTLPTVAIHREAFVQRGGWGCLSISIVWVECLYLGKLHL